MLTPSPENKNLQIASVANRVSSQLGNLVANSVSMVTTTCSEFLSARRQRREHREEMRLEHRATWSQAFNEKIFMLLDYDPTDIVSGEANPPSIIDAIHQWFIRTIWTRRIEIGGFLFIATIGALCYFAITASK